PDQQTDLSGAPRTIWNSRQNTQDSPPAATSADFACSADCSICLVLTGPLRSADWEAVPRKNWFSGGYRREASDCGENCRR
ncbi:MAG: hypothetical protein ACK5AN_16215, partial [Planctomyces sp.]